MKTHIMDIDGIPILVVDPGDRNRNGGLAIWLSGLGGAKEQLEPECRKLADAGFVAVSLDAWLHGARAHDGGVSVFERAFSNFRTEMWTILGQTTLDAFRIVDWAHHAYDLDGPIIAGGLSMGGDIAIALAGVDHRIARVGTVGSTPDWERPGMRDFNDEAEVDQGVASSYSAWLEQQFNPMRHVDAYGYGVAIDFEVGDRDTHIPMNHALTFQRLAREGSVRVNVHEGETHGSRFERPGVIDAALDFMIGDGRPD